MFNHDDRHRLARLEERLDQILRIVSILAGVEIHNMHTTEEILALANQEADDISSFKTIVNGLRGQVASLLASSSVSPTTQAQIDAVFDRMSANHVAAMAAINNNGEGIGGSTSDGSSGASAPSPTTATTETSAVASTSGNIDTSGVTMVDPPVVEGASGATGEGASGATGSDNQGATGATGSAA